jgi:hypothetical protein
MHLQKLLFVIFCHTSHATLQFPYPKQTFQLPSHTSNWICTVHITVATFENYTSSDIAERFLTSNQGMIIPTIGSMLNRSISIGPVITFFEPCTISVLIDSTVSGSSYVFSKDGIVRYINSNVYAYGGWRHSVIILIYYSCDSNYYTKSLHLPHRLFYHSTDCGPQNTFPNQVFVSDPLLYLRTINDPTYNIHDRKLPLALRRLISKPKYRWNQHEPKIKPGQCLASRWDELSQMKSCTLGRFVVSHFQHYLNFTTVVEDVTNYGRIITETKSYSIKHSISFHAIDSTNDRVVYCDRNSDSPRLRPIKLSSPFSMKTWVIFGLLLILSAIASSFAIFNLNSVANGRTTIRSIKAILKSLFELIICFLEKDLGKKNSAKAFTALIAICLGNTYKNYLTIDLVFPRAENAIRNVTELLDSNFNIIYLQAFDNIHSNKSVWVQDIYFHFKIDEIKRQKYVREADRWLRFHSGTSDAIINELASATEKNAFVMHAPYYVQVHYLNFIAERNHPLSCHFVQRPFAPEFEELYFQNPKAEDFKWWTGRFSNHGLFEFWKRLQSHRLTLNQRKLSMGMHITKSNSSSPPGLDIKNFIGQVHLFGVYMLISILSVNCVVIFAFECTTENIVVGFLSLMRRLTSTKIVILRKRVTD